jgi:glycosyltransferase involved in cell wall biosynthesis
MPVYNEEPYLAKSIESILSQTLHSYHFIITDNCSTDHSFDIIHTYANQDQRIEALRHGENIGAPENFRYSLARAKTPYFVWIGAHDVFTTTYLEIAVAALNAQTSAVMAYPRSLLIDTNDTPIRTIGSHLHTAGLPVRRRARMVLANLSDCTEIHGVFRTHVLKALPMERTPGPDALMLFLASLHGEFLELPMIGILRRETRRETPGETLERWHEQGLFQATNSGLYVFTQLVLKHIEHSLRFRPLSWLDRASILFYALTTLRRRHHVSVRDLLREQYPVFNRAYCHIRRKTRFLKRFDA